MGNELSPSQVKAVEKAVEKARKFNGTARAPTTLAALANLAESKGPLQGSRRRLMCDAGVLGECVQAADDPESTLEARLAALQTLASISKEAETLAPMMRAADRLVPCLVRCASGNVGSPAKKASAKKPVVEETPKQVNTRNALETSIRQTALTVLTNLAVNFDAAAVLCGMDGVVDIFVRAASTSSRISSKASSTTVSTAASNATSVKSGSLHAPAPPSSPPPSRAGWPPGWPSSEVRSICALGLYRLSAVATNRTSLLMGYPHVLDFLSNILTMQEENLETRRTAASTLLNLAQPPPDAAGMSHDDALLALLKSPGLWPSLLKAGSSETDSTLVTAVMGTLQAMVTGRQVKRTCESMMGRTNHLLWEVALRAIQLPQTSTSNRIVAGLDLLRTLLAFDWLGLMGPPGMGDDAVVKLLTTKATGGPSDVSSGAAVVRFSAQCALAAYIGPGNETRWKLKVLPTPRDELYNGLLRELDATVKSSIPATAIQLRLLLHPLWKCLVNRQARLTLTNLNALPKLVDYLNFVAKTFQGLGPSASAEDAEPIRLALACLSQLTFSEADAGATFDAMRKNGPLALALRELDGDQTMGLDVATELDGLQWSLRQLRSVVVPVNPALKPTYNQGAGVMVSCDPSKLMFARGVSNELKSLGVEIWVDLDNYADAKRGTPRRTMEATAKAINTKIGTFLVVCTREYRDSANCRRAAEIARANGSRMVLLTTSPYTGDGWLGELVQNWVTDVCRFSSDEIGATSFVSDLVTWAVSEKGVVRAARSSGVPTSPPQYPPTAVPASRASWDQHQQESRAISALKEKHAQELAAVNAKLTNALKELEKERAERVQFQAEVAARFQSLEDSGATNSRGGRYR